MADELGPFPGYAAERQRHAARDAQPSPRGPRRTPTATRSSRRRRFRSITRRCPTSALVDAAMRAWDRALELGQAHGYRNAQATRRRADRHHRPRHGLRHHRHRARLRAGEVQEACRRRLLQDHQPCGARSAAHARLLARPRSPRSRPTPSATARCAQAPAINHSTLKSERLHDGRARQARGRPHERLRHQVRLQPLDARRRLPDGDAGGSGRQARRPGFDLLAHLGFSKKDIEAANEHVCGAMTLEGAPHLKAEHICGLRLRQPLRPQGQALPLGREPHPHDGGVAAVHLGRHLEDDQHAERRDGRGLQGVLHAVVAPRAQGQRALSRRLEAVAAAQLAAAWPTTRTRPRRSRPS